MGARSRGAHFRERDVTRAIRAARKAGEKGEVRVVIEKEKLVVIASPPKVEKAAAEDNEWGNEIAAGIEGLG